MHIRSIDVFRALTMLLMIFVNDLWTLKDIPLWLEHAPTHVDAMGLADVVFPCFLFILGTAIPYAIRNRLAKGDSKLKISSHILLRSFALLVMGVFTVNTPSLNSSATGLPVQLFEILMVTGFFLIWNVYPKSEDWKKYFFVGVRVLGICLLVWLAFIYRGTNHQTGQLTYFRPQWWGILGLIGWTYLFCSLIYLYTYKSRPLLLISWLFFTFTCIAGHAGWLRILWENGPQEWFVGNGAFHSFAFAGVIATLLLDTYFKPAYFLKLLWFLLGLSLLMAIAAIVSHHFFIISKNLATPTWVFICCAISFSFYGFIHWLVDVKEKSNWFSIISPAGTSTLTCYLIPYLFYSISELIGGSLPDVLKTGVVGLIKSLVFALLIIGITALFGKMRIKLTL